MIYSNKKSGKIGDEDPFNKKKLADEAKRDQALIEQQKKQREKSALLLQVSNRKREVDRLNMDLRAKENLVFGVLRDIEFIKREIQGLSTELKQVKATTNIFDNNSKTLEIKETQNQMRRSKILKEIGEIDRQIYALQAKKTKLEWEDGDLLRKNNEERGLKEREEREKVDKTKESDKTEAYIKTKERHLAEAENKQGILAREVATLKAEVATKEREIQDLNLRASRL